MFSRQCRCNDAYVNISTVSGAVDIASAAGVNIRHPSGSVHCNNGNVNVDLRLVVDSANLLDCLHSLLRQKFGLGDDEVREVLREARDQEVALLQREDFASVGKLNG